MFVSDWRRLASSEDAGRLSNVDDDGAAVNAPTVTPSKTKLKTEKEFMAYYFQLLYNCTSESINPSIIRSSFMGYPAFIVRYRQMLQWYCVRIFAESKIKDRN
jgi:hypothetical protein